MEKIRRLLPNVVKSYVIPSDRFNHNDFVHAFNANDLLYGSIIEELLKYD